MVLTPDNTVWCYAGPMNLRNYLSRLDPKDREHFAERCGTTIGHLNNVSYGSRTCSESLAIAIERESKGESRCEENRPDVDWAVIRGSALPKRSRAALAS